MMNKKMKTHFVAKLYDGIDLVVQCVVKTQRPHLTIIGTAEAIWYGGDCISMRFPFRPVPNCDMIWLGLYHGDDLIEEWELLEIKKSLFAFPECEEDTEQYVQYEYGSMTWNVVGQVV